MSNPDFSALFVPSQEAPTPKPKWLLPLIVCVVAVLGLVAFFVTRTPSEKINPAAMAEVGDHKAFPPSSDPAWTHQIGAGEVFSGSQLGLVSVADEKFCLYGIADGKEEFCKPLDAPVSFTTAAKLNGKLSQVWVSGTKLFWQDGSLDLPAGAKLVAQGSGLAVVDGGETSIVSGGQLVKVAVPGTLLGVSDLKAYSASGFQVNVSGSDGSLSQLKVDAPSGLKFSRWLGMVGEHLVGVWSGDGGLVVASFNLDGKRLSELAVSNDYASANLEYSSGRNLGVFGGVVVDGADGKLYGPFSISGGAVGGFVPITSGADSLWWSKSGVYSQDLNPVASSVDGSRFLTSQDGQVTGWRADG